MFWFAILVLIEHVLSKIPCGYKEVPMTDLEMRGYDPNNLDDVIEYYEQKKSGAFEPKNL